MVIDSTEITPSEVITARFTLVMRVSLKLRTGPELCASCYLSRQ